MAIDTYVKLDSLRNRILKQSKTGNGEVGKKWTDLQIMSVIDTLPKYTDVVPLTEYNSLLTKYRRLNTNMLRAGMIMQSYHSQSESSSSFIFPCKIGSIVWAKVNPNHDYADQCIVDEFRVDKDFEYIIVRRVSDDKMSKIRIENLGITWFLINPNINETADLDKD